jgi:hypothetical protein
MNPAPKLWCASCDSSVSLPFGASPSRWTTTTIPANIAISRATIQVSVVRALRHSTGLNAGTALETASMPVIAVDPDENARSSNSAPTASVAGSRGVGAGWKP